jgi:hypothetical protein
MAPAFRKSSDARPPPGGHPGERLAILMRVMDRCWPSWPVTVVTGRPAIELTHCR